MPTNDRLVIASHLHVLLRRKGERVTDAEWMAINDNYAREIVRFSRQIAVEKNEPDISEWATRLESTLPSLVVDSSAPLVPAPAMESSWPNERPRYIGSLR